jgi:ABC-type polysaccharide/polyol phosphate export permease
VIGALLMLEILTRFGRHNVGFLWMFLEPMMFTLGVAFIFAFSGMHNKHYSGISAAAFIYVGYSTVLLWRNMPQRVICCLQPNFSLMFHRQVKPLDVYFSRLILEALGATMSMVILGIIFTIVGLVNPPQNVLKALFAWFLLAWFAFALSLFIGALSERTEIIDRIYHIVNYLMIPLSGSFFIVDMLPTAFQKLVLLNPTVSCAELFREGFFGPVYQWHYNIDYVIFVNMVLTLVGLIQVRYVTKNLVLAE